MAHANARLNLHGRRLLVARVIDDGRPVAHVAKELGISRQCAHRWVARFRAEGEAGLLDRSSRPRSCPRRTPAEVEQRFCGCAATSGEDRTGSAPSWGPGPNRLSDPAPPQVPYLRECDPLTGEVIRASKPPRSATSGTTPANWSTWTSRRSAGSPTAVAGGPTAAPRRSAGRGIGYDYVHRWSMTTLGSPTPRSTPTRRGDLRGVPAPRRRLLRRPRHRPDRTSHHRQPPQLPTLERLRRSHRQLGATPQVHPPALPLAEREGGAIQPHPADRMGLPAGLPQQHRAQRGSGALAGVLQHSTTPLSHRRPAPDQPTVMNVSAEYS